MPPLIRQPNDYECGPSAVLNAIRILGGNAPYERVKKLARTNGNGTTEIGIKRALKGLGYNYRQYETDFNYRAWAFLKRWSSKQPIIAYEGMTDHWVVIPALVGEVVMVIDSYQPMSRANTGTIAFDKDEWLNRWIINGKFFGIRLWPVVGTESLTQRN